MQIKVHVGFCNVVVGAVLGLVLTATAADGLSRAREAANRARCQSNLHQLGLAILMYQNDNAGTYPRVGWAPSTSKDPADTKPTWGTPYEANHDLGPVEDCDPFGSGKTAPSKNDVTAGLFLLARQENISASVFVCPSSKARPWDFDGKTARFFSNFKGNDCLAQHLSYSYMNMYPSADAADHGGFNVKDPDPTFAILSDMNPGSDAVMTVTLQSSRDEIRLANSLNHESVGQNVLYGDGHAEWQETPFCGTGRDNIFTAGGPELQEDGRKTALIAASPVSKTDSVLLPTAKDVGVYIPAPPKKLTPEQINKIAADLQGTYSADVMGSRGTLVIDGTTMKCSAGPMTLDYTYKVLGGSGDRLVLSLKAVDTTRRVTVAPVDGHLHFDMPDDFTLDYQWERKK